METVIYYEKQSIVLQPIYLPIELVLHIITYLLPNAGSFLERSNPATKTLLSFTRVCHETYRLARRYLREHCIYISTSSHLSSILLSIPCSPGTELRKVPSLYLAPFKKTIDDLPVALWTCELLFYASSTLKRLVIDIPLKSVCAEEDLLDVRRKLRSGLIQLEALEDFVSIQDEFSLDLVTDSRKTFVWQNWPKLKLLALYEVELSDSFWTSVGELPALDTLILVRPIGLQNVCIKTKLFERFLQDCSLCLYVVFVEKEALVDIPAGGWKVTGAGKKIQIETFHIRTPSAYKDTEEIYQEWLRSTSVENSLWDLCNARSPKG